MFFNYFVVFFNKNFLHKNINQSSAHINIRDIQKSSYNGFHFVNETGKEHFIFNKQEFGKYLEKFGNFLHFRSSVENLFEWQIEYGEICMNTLNFNITNERCELKTNPSLILNAQDLDKLHKYQKINIKNIEIIR